MSPKNSWKGTSFDHQTTLKKELLSIALVLPEQRVKDTNPDKKKAKEMQTENQ